MPQTPPDYILKNFTYYEMLKFDGKMDVATPATAPNRGDSTLQLPTALFSEPQDGAPVIPDAPSELPTPAGLDTSPYETKLDQPDNYQNPQPELTANTNKPLQTAIELIKPDKFISWIVSTGNNGQTINIPFERRAANVTAYSASYWLLSNDGGKSYTYLAYTQNISMQFTINNVHYNFPHVTSNEVTKQ